MARVVEKNAGLVGQSCAYDIAWSAERATEDVQARAEVACAPRRECADDRTRRVCVKGDACARDGGAWGGGREGQIARSIAISLRLAFEATTLSEKLARLFAEQHFTCVPFSFAWWGQTAECV